MATPAATATSGTLRFASHIRVFGFLSGFFFHLFVAAPPPSNSGKIIESVAPIIEKIGVSKEGGNYRPSSKGSLLSLWHGQNGEFKGRSKLAKLFYFGMVTKPPVEGKVKQFFFGLGDYITLEIASAHVDALCLGFGHWPNDSYGLVVFNPTTQTVQWVALAKLVGFTVSTRPPNVDLAMEKVKQMEDEFGAEESKPLLALHFVVNFFFPKKKSKRR